MFFVKFFLPKITFQKKKKFHANYNVLIAAAFKLSIERSFAVSASQTALHYRNIRLSEKWTPEQTSRLESTTNVLENRTDAAIDSCNMVFFSFLCSWDYYWFKCINFFKFNSSYYINAKGTWLNNKNTGWNGIPSEWDNDKHMILR